MRKPTIGKVQKEMFVVLMDERELKTQAIHKITKLDKPAIANALYQLKKRGYASNNISGWSLTDEGMEFVRENVSEILPKGNVRETWNKDTKTLEPKPHNEFVCSKYPADTVLRDENGKCSLCGADITPAVSLESPEREEKPEEDKLPTEIELSWEKQAKTWEKSYFEMVDRMFEITKILARGKDDKTS